MANENNKSDYTKPFMDLSKYLPEPYQSDVNVSLFNNLFNRFLTKQEISKVSGYIGQGNDSAIVSRQIKENDVHRQAYQLQPILYDKIGSVEHMASWKDIQNELERLGVDIGDFSKWGATQKFNWAPPVDINKIINYKDYYWVKKEGEPRTSPQYITIRSRCSTATSRVTYWEKLITNYGATFPIEDILEADNVNDLPTYGICCVDPLLGMVSLMGDATDDLSSGDFFDIVGTATNDGAYKVLSVPTYDGTTNRTLFSVNGLVTNETIGSAHLRRFDKLVLSANSTIVNGDYTGLFETGFVVFLRNMSNNELANSYVEIVNAEADIDNLRTIITISQPVTDNTVAGGEASLEEQAAVYTAEANCQCGKFGGWDDGALWDDNPSVPLWGDTENVLGQFVPDGISDHQNLLDRINHTVPPVAAGSDGELWHDTTANKLYQYRTATGWNVVWNNFNILLDTTTGFALWDTTSACDIRPRITATDQWINENNWLHKNDITVYAGSRRATQPIIEYDWDLELNEWTYTDYRWSYRSELDDTFIETDSEPPLIELNSITWWELENPSDINNKTIILDDRYGDLTDWFSPNKNLYVSDGTSVTLHTIDYSEYKAYPDGYPYRTYVTFIVKPSSDGDLGNLKPNKYEIYPAETTLGDQWQGYGVHWLFIEAKDAVPVPHQVDNPFIPIPTDSEVHDGFRRGTTDKVYEYRTSLYSQSYFVSPYGSPQETGYFRFELSDEVFSVGSPAVPLNTLPLRRRALYGFDDIRVYLGDAAGNEIERQFGTYDEIGEAVLDVTGIDYLNNEFLVGGDYTSYFIAGDTISLYGNTGVGMMTFTVASAPSNANRIKVVETITTTVTVDGEISNIDRPLPGEEFTNTENVTVYVLGIEFFTPPGAGRNVTIEVGEASVNGIGRHHNRVRMIENNEQYSISGDVAVSQIQYRRIEQLKTKTNQYPLFDIFNADGTPAYKANPIFGYRTSPDYGVNLNTGLRIVHDTTTNVFEFDQFLLDADDGELRAYRDYANRQEDYWYNYETNTVMFWKDITWSDKIESSNQYRSAIVSSVEPSVRERGIDGLFWYNTTVDKLFRRFINPTTLVGSWTEIPSIDRGVTDVNLQTIWKSGLNDELYIPEQVDWKRRSEEEYAAEMAEFVNARVHELLVTSSSITESQATTQATQEWYESQSNHLSSDGSWIGDWEIPDPLYFNNLHENRKYLDSRELLTHFSSIVNEQPKIPGYVGTKDGMFNLLPMNGVNYGYGGTIKEFNNGFDTLLSSVFVNNVTPRSLIDFAHDQYDNLLNSIKEIYREKAVELLSNLEPDNIIDLSSYVASEAILEHELNDQAAFVYGDSTTFTDVQGGNDLGVRNWIATLPYLNLIHRQVPGRMVDDNLSINEVIHHDGHRKEYSLTTASADIIAQILISSTDPRASSDTLGKTSSNLPPNNIASFLASFDGQISNREGVYWYRTSTGSNKLYRFVVVKSGDIQPSSSYPDGTLWMDLTTGLEVLRVKNTDLQGTVTWDIPAGLYVGDGRFHNGTDPSDLTTATVSAWQEVDLNVLLGDTIFELESRLYDNVPTFASLAYDFTGTFEENPEKYQTYLEEAFLDYVSQEEISTPYRNSNYNSSDAFTWNYSRSAQGGGFTILEADGLTNSFLIAGDQVSIFDPCSYTATACPSIVSFYVKNSGVNDGTWTTISSTLTKPATAYDIVGDTTRVFVDGDVLDSFKGIIYSGTLPSEKSSLSPNNLNDGSESGGDWRDLYTKVYGTPYPHAEPWALQGYTTKPTWWDEEYLNDDVGQWGYRTWKYKHGFEIVAANNNNTDGESLSGSPNVHGIFAIQGKFYTNFISNNTFVIDNSAPHAGTYTVGNRDDIIAVNVGAAGTASIVIADFPPDPAAAIYLPGRLFSVVEPTANPAINTIVKSYTIKSVNHAINDFTITVEEAIEVGDITVGTSFINGAMYDETTNLTIIKIQGLVASDVASGRIVEAYGMWENIRTGIIPPGRSYPSGVVGITGNPSEDILNGLSVSTLPTFNYFSVNISNVSVGAYNADDVFPPYWDYTTTLTTTPSSFDSGIRSLYYDFSTEIISPNSTYVFGDAGPVEWEWKTSSQFLYDQLTVAYRIDPMKFISSTFGFNLTEIGGLQVDRNTRNTPSHNRVDFHGEVVDGEQFKSNGLNQWYVNYNRYAGYDANFSDFRQLWTGWTAPLTYQFASFIDTPSMSLAHRYVNVTDFDYNVTSKRAPGIDDFWLDAFKIKILNIPYNIARYDNHLDWRFEVTTALPASRNIKYYDIHNYQFYADPTTDICTLYTWEILEVDTFDKIFKISGDQTYVFTAGRQFDVAGSVGNDNTYDVETSSYDSVTNTTTIFVNNTILSSSISGIITANYRTLPWDAGDGVYLSTAETLPIPLYGDQSIGLTKYFIIPQSDTTFKLAMTETDALTNVSIDITSSGRKDHFVGEVVTTFLADSGTRTDTNWRFYALDKSNLLEINTPHEIQGMQTLVNIVHGYDAYTQDTGWGVNEDKSLLDPSSQRIISWRTELERFITYAYTQRVVKEQINDRYLVTVNITSDVWTFSTENRTFVTGDPVTIMSSNSIYPTPLSRGIRYYIIRDTLDTFRLAASRTDAQDGIAINIQSIAGVADLYIVTPKELSGSIAEFEINPFRNAIWFNTPIGIVSNVITGPAEDVRTTQLIFDQNGDAVNTKQLRVYRQDEQTKITVEDGLSGESVPLVSSEYTRLHLGGLHLFTDGYEHALILNNYSSDGNLLYDPFIGLNVTKYEMLFNRQLDFTQRPNVGGYYIETFFNQGANIKENIEAGVENLRKAYDTYSTLETNLMTEYSRKGIGYEGTKDYLSNLNLSQKSQFLFWRGQIQAKGSVNAVNAYINSRRFIDAKIDDFWAIKLGEFGSMGEREYPEMYVTTVDARSNELRLEFIDNDADETSVEESFTAVKMSNTDRWYNQPNQTRVLRDNGKVMYFDMKIKNKMVADVAGSPNNIINNNGAYYIKHNLEADAVEVTQNGNSLANIEFPVVGSPSPFRYRVVNSNTIELIDAAAVIVDGNPLVIWGMVFNNDAQGPARIIDRKAQTQISPIEYWDPARGHHYSSAIHNVDLQRDTDPAQYTITPQTVLYSGIWKEKFVGTSWMNTENLDYVPYYSKEIFTDTTERFRNWGQLAEWSGIDLYEWVESDVPPAEWDALAAKEEGDRTIVEHLRKAGTARKVLFEKDGSDWVPAVNKFDEQYAATDGTHVGSPWTSLSFSISDVSSKFTGTPTGSPTTLEYLVNVYINGKLFATDVDIASGTYSIDRTNIKEADVVRFVQLVPTDQTIIDALLAGSPETHRQEYEYTQVPFYDKLGKIYYKYYFWVGNKRTKPTGKNRNMSIAEAQLQLASIPAAHMFFQEPKPETNLPIEAVNIERVEVSVATITISGSPPANSTYVVDFPIATNTTVLVEVNGADLLASQVSYVANGTSTNVTLLNVNIQTGDEIKISYTGVDGKYITIPYRFTQAIIRGLQGIVNADNRYTVRYTRDFTLRDNLDVINEDINPSDSTVVASKELKTLHEEWKIFRQEQQFNIDKWQWDKITESIIGYKLDDPSVRVPSYERQLYDEKHDTDTQYGLGINQAFVNGSLALNTIMSYLVNPDIDFTPIDINAFFVDYSFDTTANIITAMDEIYNTFSYTHVNRMYFSVLKDAFTTKAKYPDIFKTSMISLHGIRPFQTSGIFDD